MLAIGLVLGLVGLLWIGQGWGGSAAIFHERPDGVGGDRSRVRDLRGARRAGGVAPSGCAASGERLDCDACPSPNDDRPLPLLRELRLRRRPTLLLVNGLGSQRINYRVEWCEKFVAAGSTSSASTTGTSGCLRRWRPGRVHRLGHGGRRRGGAGCRRRRSGARRGLLDGRMIVQQLAIEHPERLLSMTSVMSTTGDRDVGNATEEALAIDELAGYRPGGGGRSLPGGIRAYGSPAYLRRGPAGPAGRGGLRPLLLPGGPGPPVASDHRRRQRTAAALGRCACPPSCSTETRTGWSTSAVAGLHREAIPGARFEVLEGMGHDYPPQYGDRIVSLVAAHARVGAGGLGEMV